MKDDKRKGYELPKPGLPPLIHDYLYKDADWHRFSIDWKARADLFERQYEELKKRWNIDTTKIVLNDLLTRHESERQVFKDTH